MKNIVIIGASITHGVGGSQGWADMVKRAVHQKLYAPEGPGEICEVYELGIPGQTAKDILERFEAEVRLRIGGRQANENCIVLSVGANDAKAIGEPENYTTTSGEYAEHIQALLGLAKKYATTVFGLGLTPVDKVKTNPKHNPLNGSKSYFDNDRLSQFETVFQEECQKQAVEFIPLHAHVPKDWAQKFIIADGLHPNQAGHEWIFEQLWPHIAPFTEAES
ncbi:MAG TPA: GDSL-type esterase/lipase family protein [Verrucomicrobiae bacterium]|nr:GDSL-type esterase/lipase family protein [Verrucomicrobiae bacterium]